MSSQTHKNWNAPFDWFKQSFGHKMRRTAKNEKNNLNSVQKWMIWRWDGEKRKKKLIEMERPLAWASLFSLYVTHKEPKLFDPCVWLVCSSISYSKTYNMYVILLSMYPCHICKRRISFAIWSRQFKCQNNKTMKTKSNPREKKEFGLIFHLKQKPIRTQTAKVGRCWKMLKHEKDCLREMNEMKRKIRQKNE